MARGLLRSTGVPPSTPVRVVDVTAGPNGNTVADASLYANAVGGATVANPVTSASDGALPEVYVDEGDYVLVIGGGTYRDGSQQLTAQATPIAPGAASGTYEPIAGRKVPLTAMTLGVLPGRTSVPQSVSDDGYVYAAAAMNASPARVTMIRSNDGFTTVETGQDFTSLGATGRLMYCGKIAEGYIAVTCDYGLDVSRVFFSSSFASGWSQVYTAKATLPLSIGRPTVVAGQSGTHWLIGDYNTGATRDLHLSRDGGQTWAVIKTVTRSDAGTSQHWHHGAIDPQTGRIWAFAGDNANNWTGYSDDFGATWTAVPAAGIPALTSGTVYNHPTGGAYLADGLFVHADDGGANTGIWKVDKTTGRYSVAHVVDPAAAARQWGRAPWAQLGDSEMYVLFPPASATLNQSDTAYIVGTADGGKSWHTVWSAPWSSTVDVIGENGIVGPDSLGRLYVHKIESGVEKLYRGSKPTWGEASVRASLQTALRTPSRTGEEVELGETTIDRRDLLSNAIGLGGAGTNNLKLTYFKAKKTEVISQVRVPTGSTAAAATPTLVKIGVYSVAGDGTHTLVASTASDTTLFAAANTPYTRSFTASFTKTAGQRYALAVLVVSAAATPTFLGGPVTSGIAAAELLLDPALAGHVASQADLPASITKASVISNFLAGYIYAVLLP